MKASNVFRTIFALAFLICDAVLLYNITTGDFISFYTLPYSIDYLYIILRAFIIIWMSNIIKDINSSKAYNIWMCVTYIFPYITLLFFESLKNALKLEEEVNKIEKNKGRFSPRWKAVHTIIVLIISGLALVIWGVFDHGGYSQNWNNLLVTIGATVLLSGVSSIILQIFSSISFFQREMVKTFYDILSSDDKYLASIDYKHLRKNWKILSKYLYKRKFSEISDDLSDIISDEYFPRDHPVYYEDYISSTKISILDEHKEGEFVNLKETVNLNIVANSKDEDVFYNFSSCIPPLDNSENITNVKISKFEINGENYLDKDKLEIVKLRRQEQVEFANKEAILKEIADSNLTDVKSENNLIDDEIHCIGYHIQTKKLNGHKKYKVVIELDKVYSLKTNLLKSYNARRIVKGCYVTIQYPKEMYIEFKNLGTVNKFKSISENTENILAERYESLILPSQGYIIGLRLK